MPHQCTNCSRTFPDGSKEMLSGCPDCGGNKFQFHPGSIDDLTESSGSPQSESSGSPQTQSSSATTSSAQTPAPPQDPPPAGMNTVDTPVSSRSDNDSSSSRSDRSTEPGSSEKQSQSGTSKEDTAQASARSDVVSPAEIEAAKPHETDTDAPVADDAGGDRPDIEELRNELNEQFESIKILNPGQYEINLMELYDRDEYIISLREDGRYVIEVPDAWGVTDRE
ncbi:Zn-ribbon domain-containing protein [Halalkalirubrum salinum]|uniref:Zn-ribbon domain-containing protein n=1 Tax=Halalkalirubrum salinum TaxID=2563889 RepID=UPI0010FB19B6|nr:Zn-ribbon containing protein [Halalkalirubrum salinum]